MQQEVTRGFLETQIELASYALRFSSEYVAQPLPFKYKGVPYRICLPNFVMWGDFGGMNPSYSKRGDVCTTFEGTKVKMVHIYDWGAFPMSRSQIEEFGKVITSNKSSYSDFGWNLRVDEFDVRILLVHSVRAVDAKTARKYKRELTEWKTIFPLWLQAVEFLDLSDPGGWVEQPGGIDGYFIPLEKYAKRIRTIRAGADNAISATVNNRTPLRRSVIDKALRRSERGVYPPAYYVQLINALRHYNRGRYRQSIFDTATAFEMALTQVMEAQLKNLTKQQSKLVTKNYRGKGINALFQAISILGRSGSMTQADVEKYISRPRNAAIHRGEDVSASQAREALDYVRQFIYGRLPL